VFEVFSKEQLTFAIHEDYDARLVEPLHVPPQVVFQSDRPEEYLPIYTNPENVVLAMRLHAGMLALATGVPAVWVGHDTRTYSFCQMMGLEWTELFSQDSARECISRVRCILEGDVSSFAVTATRFRGIREGCSSSLRQIGFPATGSIMRRTPTPGPSGSDVPGSGRCPSE